MNTSILFSNHKLPSIYSESVPRSRSIASTYSYAKNSKPGQTTSFNLAQLSLSDIVRRKQWEKEKMLFKAKPSKACSVSSLPNDKILDWSKLKAFAEDKFNSEFVT